MEKSFTLHGELRQVMDGFDKVTQLLIGGDYIYNIHDSDEGYHLVWYFPTYQLYRNKRTKFADHPLEFWLPTEFQFVASAFVYRFDGEQAHPLGTEEEAMCFDLKRDLWLDDVEILARCPHPKLANSFGAFLMLAGQEWGAARFSTSEADLRLMWELKLHVSPEQWELWKTARWAAPYLATVENVQGLEDLPTYEPPYELVDESTKERTPATQPKDSGHYAYPSGARKEIVERYREAQARGQVQNKEAWAQTKYQITRQTLLKYEKEFPEEQN